MQVLVVDDDRVLAEILAFTLQRIGLDVIQAYDGRTALERWSETEPDLVILDVNLPDVSGFEICRQIRAEANTPIILLTARDKEDDIVHGLEIGADDYITKPYSPRQLVARVQAALRRSGARLERGGTPTTRKVGDVTLILDRREVSIAGDRPVSLTPLEAQLLETLMLNAGRVLTSATLIDQIWGPQGGNRSMLRQLVHRLRRKIEPDPAQPTYIETVPGLGYGLIQK
jgi:DNA-binding response OmpR family regulator